MDSREILTVQFGHLSNYVGAHYWNQQDEYFARGTEGDINYLDEFDMDRLYRSGVTLNGESTFTPRVLLFDMSGNFGSLSANTSVYTEPSTSVPTWQGKVSTFRTAPEPKNKFLTMLDREEKAWRDGVELETPQDEAEEEDLELDTSVQTWSDFLKVHLHPRSLASLNVPSYENDFSSFMGGLNKDLITNDDLDTYYEQFRFFLEECGHVQAIQVFADLTDGFGGLTSRFLDLVNDECPNTSVVMHGVVGNNIFNSQHTSNPTNSDRLQQIGMAFAYNSLLPKVTTFIPVTTLGMRHCSPYLDMNPRSIYHSSAVLAATFETYTTPLRMRSGGMSASQWCQAVSADRRYKVLASEVSLPMPLQRGAGFERAFTLLDEAHTNTAAAALWSQGRMNPFTHSLFPHYAQNTAEPPVDTRMFANALFMRNHRNVTRPDSGKDIFPTYMRSGCTLSCLYLQDTPLPLPLSYPKIFRGVDEETAAPLGSEQDIRLPQPGNEHFGFTSADRKTQCLSTATAAAVGAGPFMHGHLNQTAQDFHHRRATVSTQLEKIGLLQEDLADMSENLFTLAQLYQWDASLEL